MKIIVTNGKITGYSNSQTKRDRKPTVHSPEFLAKHEAKLKEKLIAQIKTEDPRPFINTNSVPVIRINRLPGEVYKLIPGTTRYYVSNLGNALKLVYDKFTDVYLEHPLSLNKSKNKTGRIYSDIFVQTEDGEHTRCRLSRAMAKTFLDPTFPLLLTPSDRRVADHIDNNSENNNIDNIRICEQSENIRYAIYEQNKKVGAPAKKCYAFNINTKELREYDSTGECCRDIWNSSNKGYFHTANKNKAVSKHGWKVSYNKEDFDA